MRVHVPEDCQDKVGGVAAYAPEIVAAALNLSTVTYQKSRLSLREFEGARARTAEINGCQICQKFRAARDLPGYLQAFGLTAQASVADRGPAPDEAFYQSVSAWRSSPLYSDRERIAIEYAERMGTNPRELAVDEIFWMQAKAAFSDAEIVDLSYCIAGWMANGRVGHVLGMDTVCAFMPDDAEAA